MVAPFIHDKFDIGILRQDGSTKVGMMLVKDKYQNPSYRVYDDEYLAAQFFSGAPGYGNLPPEKELALRQDDWRSGFGLEVYDSNETKRYYTSDGMDMRFRGMGICGPTPTAVTIPDKHNASAWNYGDRTEDPDSSWADDDNVLASAGSATHLDVNGWGSYIYVFFPAMTCSNTRFTWGESTTNIVIGWDLDAYYDGPWNDVVTLTGGNPSPGTITTAITPAKTVTALRLRFQDQSTAASYTCSGIEMYADSASIIGTTIALADFNGDLYITKGNALIKIANSDGAVTYVDNGCFLTSITDLEVF